MRLLTVMQPVKSTAAAFRRQDVALQLSCLSLFLCAAAIALVTANAALAKVRRPPSPLAATVRLRHTAAIVSGPREDGYKRH